MTKQTNRKPGATAAASATAPNGYSRITNCIVADLEQGVRPWCKPWGGDQLGARITRPRRANGKPYSGINTPRIPQTGSPSGYVRGPNSLDDDL